ncbi:MAG: hypothetical protein HFH92_08425 [Lachnospiraceae bacterium]|uniref:hypothetical protein n=1 Tax=uncultured Acetatifactor sp. TaxID=1671927 RepID=UPI0026349803|nr:hypothetical protein [uncultured Acetatifactor sp.]MCI8789118.1 hypothetical protein [Lachnospiraceae bacterium]
MANLTPEDIGALNKNGDTANGKIFFKKGTMVNYNNGVPAVSGFVILAQIKITDIYVNNPIFMRVCGRGKGPTDICIMFENTVNADPAVVCFWKYGFDVSFPIYIKKIESKTWQICFRKSESYGSASVIALNYEQEKYYDITFPNTQINDADFVVSEWREAEIAGTVNEAKHLSNLTATNTVEFSVSGVTGNYIGYLRNPNLLNPVYGQNDGAFIRQYYDSKYEWQIYGDYRTGQMALQYNNNGSWGSWRKVVDHLNFRALIPNATTSASGLMSKEDKTKLNDVVSQMQVLSTQFLSLQENKQI